MYGPQGLATKGSMSRVLRHRVYAVAMGSTQIKQRATRAAGSTNMARQIPTATSDAKGR